MYTLAFDAKRLIRPALRTIVSCFLIIVIPLMTMVKIAHASGTITTVAVPAVATYRWMDDRGASHSPNGTATGYWLNPAEACVAGFSAMFGVDKSPDQYGYWWHFYGNYFDPATGRCKAWGILHGDGYTTSPFLFTDYPGLDRGMACPNGHTIAQLGSTGLIWGPVLCNPPCPANSTRSTSTTCTCNTDFKPDLSATSCVPEQYTISLVGLGGEVMPTKTLTTAYAEVTPIVAGTSRSGVQVNLKLEVVPEEDGNNHAVGQHIAPHEGSLTPVGRATTLTGTTDAEGKFRFVFYAPEAGGTHTITATCANNKCTNQDTGKITVPGCPIDPLTDISKLSELWDKTPEEVALTQKLEGGINGYSLLTPATQAAEQCLAERVNTAVGPPSLSGYKVTSTVRTYAYQEHLWEVWDKFWELKRRVDKDTSIKQRCQMLITKVEGEMGFHLSQDPMDENDACNPTLGRAHCIRYQPAQDDPKHVKNIAFDIPPKTVMIFDRRLKRPPPSTVQKEANSCGLTWGGTFSSADRVHFLCCAK